MKIAFALAALSLATAAAANVTVDFSDKPLADDTYVNDRPFVSNGVGFNNRYEPFFWRGWSYSAVSDVQTAGYTNDEAAITGSGVGGAGTYAVGYYSEFESFGPVIDLPAGERASNVQVTNTTYAYLSMRDGDDYAKKFGGANGADPDAFSVTFTGYAGAGATGATTGATTFYLADFRGDVDYIIDAWTTVDLTGLGDARSIALTFTSTDVNENGTKTPTYVAIDNLVLVPEPTTLAALGGLCAFALRRHRGSRGR